MHYHYCPQCGTKLTDKQVGDDGQVPFCTQCGKYWFDTFASCIIILLCNEENEVVLCKQNHLSNRYETITSGFITPGETAEHAAYREVQQELGLTVDKLLYEGTYWFGSGDMLMHGYIGFVKKAPLRLSQEIQSAHWVPLLHLPETAFPDNGENVIFPLWRKLLAMKGLQEPKA